MTRYICKCGRVVHKSTNAYNTGNRETDGCEGCPYLLPWGPTEWDDTRHAIVLDVKGYECRMSKDLEYSTRFCGSITDKCSCYIASLDFDFLAHVSEWIEETYPDRELCGHFSINTIRAVEYVSNGRYRMSIVCAQNKKGIAAKAALMHRFFDENGARIDMTPEEEKTHILAVIDAGKARVQKGKEKNVKYIISEHQNGLMYAYYKNLFWFWDKDQKKWISSSFAEQRYKQALQKDSKLTPEIFMDSGDFYTLDEYEIPMQRLIALETLTAAVSTSISAVPASNEPPEIIDESSEPEATTNPIPAAPASHADAGAATQNLSAADPASLEARPSDSLAFDFGADAETNAALLADAQIFMAGSMARVMAAKRAHDRTANNYRGSWGKWCELVGISRDTGDNMVRVAEQFGNIQRDGKSLIDIQPLKLLYEASKATTPPEIRTKVENLDITTHKQYQELLEKYKSEQQAHQAERESTSALLRDEQQRRQKADEARIAADRRAESAQAEVDEARRREVEARAAAHKYHVQVEEVEAQRNALLDQQTEYIDRIHELESRPVEVAVQEPTEEQIAAAAKQRTAMLEAQVRSLQADKDSALRQLDELGNTAYMAAAEFADNAARTVDSIRTAFWALAKELSEDDFADALAPLDEAVRKIYEREWDDEESEA